MVDQRLALEDIIIIFVIIRFLRESQEFLINELILYSEYWFFSTIVLRLSYIRVF